MFRQMRLDRRDTDLLRIIWRENPKLPLRVFRLLTVTYGTKPAPFQAIRTLLQLASLYCKKYPRASRATKKNRYMDDFLAGEDSEEAAAELIIELIELMKEGGFTLGKWSSNRPNLLPESPTDQAIDINATDCVSTLGLTWVPSRDTFKFKVEPIRPTLKITKRSILSETASLFDPLGWLSPVVIVAKVVIQDLWLSGLAWDEPVSPEIEERWIALCQGLPGIRNIEIPRWFGTTSGMTWELHGFSDASERAYAACVYLVARGQPSTARLVMAKTRVAPVKTLSMPRLELCGAHLLARLMSSVLAAQEYQGEIFCWTDAKIVLNWLSDHPSKWTVFVATRVSEILSLLPKATWRYVPSAENPADIATRGASPHDLQNSCLWWQGPTWLLHGPLPNLPRPTISPEELPERRTKAKFSFVVQQANEELISQFSSYQRLLRVIAYVLRVLHPIRKGTDPLKSPWLTTLELLRAKTALHKYVQFIHFNSEIQALERGERLPRTSTLKTLRPFIDNQGVLRVGGRLTNAELSYDEMHPVILPKYSHLTKLLIRHAHLQNLHGGPQLTRSYLNRSHWIIHGKAQISTEIKECVRCARFSVRPQPPLMGELPASRVSPTRPFYSSGMDYAGPINVRMSKGRGNRSYKGYICIFVCMSTRAVHIEVASDATSASFLAAFRRFISRRGRCAELFSDNGTNFQGASAEMRKMLRQALKQGDVASHLENEGTSWKFIPPGAPHFGGIWEAAVKATKHHLRRVIGDSTLTYEELSTFLTQVEACLNSRPLTALSTDPQDVAALTPAHFLIGSSLVALPEAYEKEVPKLSLSNRWLQLTHLRNQFWRKWSTEYLHSLQQRFKWQDAVKNLKVGDLVLIFGESLPPTKWPLGRIIQVHPGDDGVVRVVTLRTATTTLTRPVAKLCRLPVAVDSTTS